MQQHPRFLYRYRPVNEFSLGEIAHNTVYLCPPTRLNDDLEGTFGNEPSDPNELRAILSSKALEDGEPEFALLIALLPDDALMDIAKHAEEIGVSYTNARGKWGVVCFTERFNNLQMWERYANGGNGVVIEYDTAGVEMQEGALWRVQYTEARGTTSVTKAFTSKEGAFSEVLTYKKPRWSYEEEWRLLADRQGLVRLTIPISRVITGPGMQPTDKNKVVQTILHHGRARFAQLTPRGGGKFFLHDLAGTSEDLALR